MTLQQSSPQVQDNNFFGLVLPQRLDGDVPANKSLDETGQLNWIIAAFNLTSAAFIPFWGQVADIFGRHVPMQACLVSMLVGSALCTGAPTSSFAVLLLGAWYPGPGLRRDERSRSHRRRGQGLSAGERKELLNLYLFRRRLGMGIWSVLGGYITSGASWRWCFAINLPVAFTSMLLVYFVLRSELLGPQPIPSLDETTDTGRRTTFAKRLQTIEAGGQVLFLFGFGLLVLGLTWAGATYSWRSPAVVVTITMGAVLIVLFCPVFAAFLGNVYIGKTEEGDGERRNAICEGVYLLKFRRKGQADDGVSARERESGETPLLWK
ncbi:Protein SGE1 [Colletotrichum sidae]|uniref:Protein SGE1 n=1 Tax=Colletotrichum sidae TaxID=1347389 RepID=A0A4R8TNI9_9PEZI|nr:Protein SGE1 [Colletotrichum sidae]